MAKLYVCPCCEGQGLVHDDRGDGDTILECVECGATGRVTRRHRDELLDWQHRCRLRPLAPAKPATAKARGRR